MLENLGESFNVNLLIQVLPCHKVDKAVSVGIVNDLHEDIVRRFLCLKGDVVQTIGAPGCLLSLAQSVI